MKLLLILLIVFKADISVAQKSSILQGKWRIIALSQVISTSRDSLYYDLDKDSIYIPSEDLREASKDGLDSIRTVNLFKSMYESFKNSTFTFVKDSVILEYKTSKAIGTYHIKSNDTLDMHLLFDEKEQEHLIYTFLLTGDILNILLKQDIGYTRFVLKKE
jgi:hypothetical protein